MELMDRALQLRILRELTDCFPTGKSAAALDFKDNDPRWVFNIAYLHQHGLVDVVITEYLSEPPSATRARITARGLDFLQDDGGLTAILGVVTVRLDAQSIEALLVAKVNASELPEPEKSRIKSALHAMGAEGLKEATKRLVSEGLDRWPQVIGWLQTLPG